MPQRCHRLLISNTLTARGWNVTRLMNDATPMPHELSRWGAEPRVGQNGIVTCAET